MFSSKIPSRILSRKSLVARSYFVLSVVSFIFSGCLSDPITGPEVRARLVLPPQRVMFSSPIASFVAPATGDMVIRWTRSPADTQLNFKGYYVRVWKSKTDTNTQLNSETDTLLQLMDTAHILRVAGRLDTSVTFHSLPLAQYSAFVWGEKATDTLGYSLDSTKLTFPFDPRPLQNPTNLRATSTSTNGIKLTWDYPASHTNSGSSGYVVYYRNPNVRNDSAHYFGSTGGKDTNWWPVTLPPRLTPLRGTVNLAYQIWVKSIRNDSTIFYGQDTNTIVWSGAEVNPQQAPSLGTAHDPLGNLIPDTSYKGFRHSIFMGQIVGSPNWVITDDSTNIHPHQFVLQINGSALTLNATNGAAFLSDGGTARMDTAYDLAQIFYTVPYSDPSQFTIGSATLSNQSAGTGVVLYLMFPDADLSFPHNEWARIFILRQLDGTFVNHSGGVDLQVSFQPGVTWAGDAHLPYY